VATELKKPKGKLIVFSGIDGAGKSTQIERLETTLRERKLDYKYLWSRGGYTPGFNLLKKLTRKLTGKKILPPGGESEQRGKALSRPLIRKIWITLSIFDLLWVYCLQIRKWIYQGKHVICDRFLLDTLIDFNLNFPQEKVQNWWSWKLLNRLSPTPDRAFLLLVPVSESIRRSNIKNEPFRESTKILTNRLSLYETLYDKSLYKKLDGLKPPEVIENEILTILKSTVQIKI